MSLVSVFRPSVWPSASGVNIAIPIKCTGQAVTATINLYIYHDAFWSTPGSLIASYTQTVAFTKGEQKTITFVHDTPEADVGGRDVGIEIVVEDRVVASELFQDLYSTDGGGGGGITDIIGPMMMIMMMGMVMPMMTGMMGGEETGISGEEGGII